MRNEKLLEDIRIFLRSKAIYGAIFLIFVVGVFLYVILGSNMFLVSVDGHARAVVTVRDDAQGVIDLCNVELQENDVVEFTAPTETSAGILNVRRAFYVYVTADNCTEAISVIEGTVLDAIEKCGIVLGEYDEVEPSLESHLESEMNIKVSHVTYEIRKVEESVPYQTREYKSSLYMKRTRHVTQKGENGVKMTTYRDKYRDGVKVSSTIVSVTTTKKPVTELVAVGTSTAALLSQHVKLAELQNSGERPAEDAEYTVMQGTAYTYSKKTSQNTTACGTPVGFGVVAVDPDVIPYGTILYIESVDGRFSYGYCIAEDTGVSGNHVDLFYESASQVYKFGRRKIKVYVVG